MVECAINTTRTQEVELALRQLRGVCDVVVVPSVATDSATHLVAYVVPEDWPGSTEKELREAAAGVLAGHELPAMFVPIRELPLRANGELDRHALPTPERDALVATDRQRVTPDELETRIIEVWKKELELVAVGLDDDFFDLGGSSIDAVAMFSALDKTHGYDLAPTTLLHAPTVRDLAAVIRAGAGARSQESLVPIRALGTKMPLICIHGGGGGIFFVRNMAERLDADRPVFALQAAGFDGTPPPYRPVEDMATRYLNELRMVQPHGPYALTGLSFGGLVAWEMAQQLRSAGEEIAMLALLDTKPFERLSAATLQAIDEAALGVKHRRVWRLVGLSWRKGQRIAKKILLACWLKTGRPLPDLFRLRNSYFWPLHARAAREYEVLPYDGFVTIVSEQGATEIHREVWDDRITGGYEITEVQAAHLDLQNPPYVYDVVEHLEVHMKAAEGDTQVSVRP